MLVLINCPALVGSHLKPIWANTGGGICSPYLTLLDPYGHADWAPLLIFIVNKKKNREYQQQQQMNPFKGNF